MFQDESVTYAKLSPLNKHANYTSIVPGVKMLGVRMLSDISLPGVRMLISFEKTRTS